ncbi:RagB/SusD family nutrient uptake outer membrane protein [Flavobacteriaceae bacterium F08102]|nr:RagB/SusD family nutrient uptake outer membrane protein [Flavobacteriaceae bacterium F08102]
MKKYLKMNKITYLYILLFIGITSCEDYLEVKPANQRTIETVEDVKGILGGYLKTVVDPGYHLNSTGNPYEYTWYKDTGFLIDGGLLQMFAYYENSFNAKDFSERYIGQRFREPFLKGANWSSIDDHKRIWKNGYLSIGLMNNVINELEIVKKDDGIEVEIIKGEAKIIRAWNALKLLQYFTPFDNNELGIPLNFNAETVATTSGKRRTQEEVFNTIIKELNEVLNYTAETDENYNVFYRKSVIHAILAKTYFYKATGPVKSEDDWEKVIKHSDLAMEGKALAVSGDDLKTMFKNDVTGVNYQNPHTLISFFWSGKTQFSSPSGTDIWGYIDMAYNWGEPYYAGVRLSPEIESLYNDGDIRLGNNVYTYDLVHNEFSKYLQDGYEVRNVYPMFRVADLFLMKAEAYARIGETDEAKLLLDEFKTARNAGTYSEQDVLKEILNERKKEFFIEYDYIWLDMKRNRVSMTRTIQDPSSGGAETQITLASDDYRYAFYIPLEGELDINSNLTQNPNWDNQ